MKKIFITFILSFIIISTYCQTSGGPDSYGYTWKNSNHTSTPPQYKWVDITTTGTQITGLGDDNVVGPIYLSAGFHFYWYDVTKFWIGSNGYITFNGDNIASPFPASIPLSSGANNWLAPLLADLNFSGTGNPAKCYYYTNADSIVISFIDVPFWVNATTPYTGQNTFQIILSRLDSSVVFNYLVTNMGTLTSLDDAVGIENITGSLGLSNYIDALPPDTMAIKYYYPKVVTYQVTDAGIMWNNNTKNGGIFIKNGGGPITLKANVRNLGNQNISLFTAYDTVINMSNSLMTSGSKAVVSLAVGKDSIVTFPNKFNPTTAGTYSFITNITGITNDMVASNNRLIQEIIAIDTTKKTMTLDYSDGASNGGLGWNGGNGGIAEYFEPPFYPCKIVSTRFYITANATTPVGFYAKIYDDNGPNGSKGTLLDSVYVAPSNVTLNSYITVNTSNTNLRITSGGVYLYWEMGGAGINLGRDNTPPVSRRTFEVLMGSWAEYRSLLVEDFLMGINIEYTFPIADFTADSSMDPQISYTDKSSNTPTSWLWDFGDGSTSTAQHPIHTYTLNGKYKVCLKATNADGNTTTCKYITIDKVPPVAAYTYDTINDPSITFTDASTNIPTSWLWDFDDAGSKSTVANPTYKFKSSGYHHVCLTVSNAGGNDSVCKQINIKYGSPDADFVADTTLDPKLLFSDKSKFNPTSWYWEFNDNGATSILQNPNHTFSKNGTYKVCLKASNPAGSDTICKNFNIKNWKPTAKIEVDSNLDPLVQFYDSSLNIPTYWRWDFGEGGASSNLKNPQYKYKNNGLHKVCLFVSNAGGSDSTCRYIFIDNVLPTADFSFDASNDPEIKFTDKSTNLPTSWLWDFDDNYVTSNSQNPVHVFSTNGNHNVCLIASNAGGRDTLCKKITIINVPPKANYSYINSGDPLVVFTDKSENNPTTWLWNFDDNGATSSLQNPTYTFTKNGNHKVCLKVSNGGGIDSFCSVILIRKVKPVADFSADTSLDPKISFTDLSLNEPSNWNWDFDDNGAYSNLQNPVYTFTKNGNFNICLTVTNQGGNNTVCKKITIRKNIPKADFIFNSTNDPSISFTDKSTNLPLSWKWDFDEYGATSTLQNPNFSFLENGDHKVCLTVTNEGGSDSICKNVVINKALPVAHYGFNTDNMPTVLFADNSTGKPTSWKWKFNDKGNDSSDVQNPSYTFKTDGKHNVCLTVTNIAGTSAPYCREIVVSGAGVESSDIFLNNLIYPNPFTTYTNIVLPVKYENSHLTINIIDITGKVQSKQFLSGKNILRIDRGEISSGCYIIEVWNEAELIVKQKVMIE